MAENITIEALFAPGCESRDNTLLMIDKVVNSQGVTVDFKETTIGSIPEATNARFLGSPSIRVDGRDVETESEGKTDYGVGWRVYLNEAGRFLKTIPEKLLIDALARLATNTTTWEEKWKN